MVSAEQIKAKIAAYEGSLISLGDFEDWFYDQTTEPINSSDLEAFVEAIDSLLSRRHFGSASQRELRSELKKLAQDPVLCTDRAAAAFVEKFVTYVFAANNNTGIPHTVICRYAGTGSGNENVFVGQGSALGIAASALENAPLKKSVASVFPIAKPVPAASGS